MPRAIFRRRTTNSTSPASEVAGSSLALAQSFFSYTLSAIALILTDTKLCGLAT